MAIRKFIITLALSSLALPGFVIAQDQSQTQHRVTVQTRSGERISGLLQDVENGTVFVRTSQHDQRRLPIGDVLVIDLVGGASGLPESELSAAARDQHLVVLRNGTSWTGQFVDVRGGEASAAAGTQHELIFRTGNEERRIGMDQVGRIYFGNYPRQTASTEPTSVPSGAIRVPGNAAWVPTGIMVRRGDRLVFNASGEVHLSEDGADVARPAGSTRARKAAGAPMPNDFAGALIGKVGNSAPFGIGDLTTPITMPARGELFLGVNDDHVNDNRGEFVVQIQNVGATRQR